MKISEGRINSILTGLLSVIVLPVLLTAAFSRLVVTRDLFEESVSFFIEKSLEDQIGMDCSQPNCGYQKISDRKISVYRSQSGLITFQASQNETEQLKAARQELIEKIDDFIGTSSCLSDPVKFSGRLLLRKLVTSFAPDDPLKNMQSLVGLGSSIDRRDVQENAKLLCERLTAPLKNYFISDIYPTRLYELRKMKMVIAFYMGVAFLAFMIFYVYPRYKKKKE